MRSVSRPKFLILKGFLNQDRKRYLYLLKPSLDKIGIEFQILKQNLPRMINSAGKLLF
jgi:hypothetical protein